MDTVLSVFEGRPYLWALVALVVGALLFAALKRLLKLAVLLAIGFAALIAYFAYSGRPTPDALQRVEDKVREGAKRGADRAKALGAEVKKEAAAAARREAEAKADELRDAAEDALE